MSEIQVTVAIPTLTAGPKLAECLASLERQTLRDFEVLVIDNSGKQLARETATRWGGVAVVERDHNVGFGAAINDAVRRTKTPYIATLNDDAIADPGWLAALVGALESRTDAGMCASQVRLAGSAQLDSAGMLISDDASSKQRGHMEPPAKYLEPQEVLLPSGCAALYRRKMLEQIGLFDEDFFLYCEDTDLGLRARWAGWKCLYAPEAIIEHHYSQTAGAASPLKAYYVERNRLFVLLKNFPLGLVLRAPGATLRRYFWHLISAMQGRGSAAQYQAANSSLFEMVYIAARAHVVLFKHAPRLLRQRREIQRNAQLGVEAFEELLAAHSISPREVAAL